MTMLDSWIQPCLKLSNVRGNVLSCRFCCVPLGAESPALRCIRQGARWSRGLREHRTQDLQPRPPWPSLFLFMGSFIPSRSSQSSERPHVPLSKFPSSAETFSGPSSGHWKDGETKQITTHYCRLPPSVRGQGQAGTCSPRGSRALGADPRRPGRAASPWRLELTGLLHPTPGPSGPGGAQPGGAATGDPGVLGADPALSAARRRKHRALDGKRAENF